MAVSSGLLTLFAETTWKDGRPSFLEQLQGGLGLCRQRGCPVLTRPRKRDSACWGRCCIFGGRLVWPTWPPRDVCHSGRLLRPPQLLQLEDRNRGVESLQARTVLSLDAGGSNFGKPGLSALLRAVPPHLPVFLTQLYCGIAARKKPLVVVPVGAPRVAGGVLPYFHKK